MTIGVVWRSLLAVMLVVWANACTPKPPPLFALFPDATQIHAYASPTSIEMHVDKQGGLRAGAVSQDGAKIIPAPIVDGGLLTPVETRQLRAAISLSKTPASTVACCSPRHAFLFYDRAGKYLGFVSICFECGCVEMWPYSPPRPNFPLSLIKHDPAYLNWDRSAIRRIVEAHHLTPLVPPRPETAPF